VTCRPPRPACPLRTPEIFTRAWADHEAMLAALDDLTTAADRVRAWVTAKHTAMA
jgi:hypothetical protein